MDSFYGGKQGISFIIKDSFKTIAEMNQHFADSSYTKTWYGEYCIIDTVTKNDIDNGKVFRRTAYKGKETIKTKDTQYAEYIGQIIGPAGGIPNIEFEDINTLKNNFDNLATSIDTSTPAGNIYYKNATASYTQTVTKGEGAEDKYSDNLYITDESVIASNNVIYKSGKDYTAAETPAFKYGFYTFQPKVSGTNSNSIIPTATIGIGFEIPYVDFDTPIMNMLPYNASASVTVNSPENNKFLYQHTFNLPGGAPGYHFANVRPMQTDIRAGDYEKKIVAGDSGKTFYFEQKINNVIDTVSGVIQNNLQFIKMSSSEEMLFVGGQILKGYFENQTSSQAQMYLFPMPNIYPIDKVDYVPNRSGGNDYISPASQYKITNFDTTTILVCQIEYPSTGTNLWNISDDWFYLAGIPGIKKTVPLYDYDINQYKLYVEYDGWKGPIYIQNENDDSYAIEGGYYVGLIGPTKLGLWVTHLYGTLTRTETDISTVESPDYTYDITITPASHIILEEGGTVQGNLGILNTNEITIPAGWELPEGFKANENHFYIWDVDFDNSTAETVSGTWKPMSVSANDGQASIDTSDNIQNYIKILGANQPAILFAQTQPNNTTPAQFEAAPWK